MFLSNYMSYIQSFQHNLAALMGMQFGVKRHCDQIGVDYGTTFLG